MIKPTYTEQEINQTVEQIGNMCLGSRNKGKLLFRCKWIIKQLQDEKKIKEKVNAVQEKTD